MPLKDRFRRAIRTSTQSSDSASDSSESSTPIASVPQSGISTPIPSTSSSPPTITLTKTNTSSRLSLSKTLTWGKRLTPEEKEQKKLAEWQKKDAEAWNLPSRRYQKHKSKAHQDILRSFEMKFKDVRTSFDSSRRSSLFSGVSPGQSRMNSMDIGRVPFGARKRSSVAGMLSREVSRDDSPPPNNVGRVLDP